MLISFVVDFDPGTAEMASGAIRHPYHVLSGLCSVTCLGVLLEIKIQLSWLIRPGLLVRDGRFHGTIHYQRNAVNTWLQAL